MPDALKSFGRTHEARLLLVNLTLFIFLSVAAQGFFSLQNGLNLMTSYAFAGILAAGLVVVLVSGGIDISFTAVASIAQYLAVSAVTRYDGGWFMLFGVALGVGLCLGLFNAVLITWLRISSIIVTIALLNVYYGLLMFLSGGDPINSLPAWYADGLYWILGEDEYGNPYILSMQILGLVLAFMLSAILLNRLGVGRQLRALGGNPEAAKRVGFSELRLNMVAYGFMGLMAGMASLVQAQVSQSVV
ncbi:MAG: ABC transporter permease, partial [Methylobacteriaceae bacterium]